MLVSTPSRPAPHRALWSSRLRVGKAIEINPEYGKAYYRRGISYLAILRPTDAVPDFKKALNIEPGNRAAREQLTATVKLIRRIEFEKVSCASPYLPTNCGPCLAWSCFVAVLMAGNFSWRQRDGVSTVSLLDRGRSLSARPVDQSRSHAITYRPCRAERAVSADQGVCGWDDRELQEGRQGAEAGGMGDHLGCEGGGAEGEESGRGRGAGGSDV